MSGVFGGKRGWKRFPPAEISATRLSFSGSLRPKIGLCIFTILFISLSCLICLQLFNNPPKFFSAAFKDSQSSANKLAMASKLTSPDSVKTLASANDKLTTKLHNQLSKEGKNMVMSGFSLSAVMAMAAEGTHGNTKKEIQELFKFPENQEILHKGYTDITNTLISKEAASNKNYTLNVANSIFVHQDYELKKPYIQTLKEVYQANPQNLNFGEAEKSRKFINDWVKEKTKDKIENLLGDGTITAMTRVVLVNALYFKGDWAEQFDKQHTEKRDFHVTPSKSVKVDMMYSGNIKFGVKKFDELSSSVLEMPYKGDRISMYIILPNQKSISVETVETKLNGFDLGKLDQIKHRSKVELFLPKFKIESSHDLLPALKELGLKDLFDSNAADFSQMTAANDLFVSSVVQKAVIEVNEEGSEAAAATGMVMMMRSMPLPPAEFRVDRPFLFLIRDKLTGLVLFSGKISDPSSKE